MDFLPRYFTSGALVGALCLAFSAPAFAVLDNPNYSWRLSSSGDVYRVYDPEGARASSTFTSSSTFAEGDSGGVIQSFSPQPLTIDGATGEVVTGLSRSLTVGDLVDGLGKLFSLDNPIGLTILAASTLGPLALQIYDNYEGSQSSSPSYPSGLTPSCGSNGAYFLLSKLNSDDVYIPIGPISQTQGMEVEDSDYPGYGAAGYDWGTGPDASVCPSSGVYTPSSLTPPSNLAQWIDSNWTSDNLANDASTALQDNPSYGPDLATQLANNNAPMPTPVPYAYTPTSNSLSQSPTTTTSTNPSTGDSTSTTTTPSFKVSPGTDGGLSVTQNDTSVTSSCTSAGSCTVTNTSSSSQTPKTASPFVSPTISSPSAPTSSVKSFALSFVVPAQSDAVCPHPLSFTALSHVFNIPLAPLCNLAVDVKPYVESMGAVGAGIVIFR